MTVPAATAGVAAELDVSALWEHAFPSTEMVAAAAALLTPLRGWDGREGARARLTFGPGMVRLSRHDPARAERAFERDREARWKMATLRATDYLLESRLADGEAVLEASNALATAGAVGWDEVERDADWCDHLAGRIERRDNPAEQPTRQITAWSAKSRARMVRTLAGLDYAPLFESAGVPAMLTLTYPGDWLAVAPDARTCKAHMDSLAKRFRRAYGRPLLAIWKREFQRRGAPHFHLLMVPPHEQLHGEGFAAWVSRVWSEIVGASTACACGEGCLGWCPASERARHRAAGTGIDYAEGMRARDPKRLAIYFNKHGAYAAKEYQNVAPDDWIAAGSIGRFWGVWGLEQATVTVEVTPVEALAAARTMRRWQRANGYRVQRTVWRADRRTGELRPRKSGVWVGARMRGSAGFVTVNDGASFGARLARHLDAVRERAQRDEMVALGAEPWFWGE